MRLAYYAGASTAAAAACLLKAFHERPNFYSATVYLSQSNACLLILTNLSLMLACSLMFALQRLLYGPLRPIEIEQLSEKAWYAVLDTLLAMPSFREDVGGWLLIMFVLLLAGKVWGWIGEGRVDILEQQPPANPRLFHARLATSLILSVLVDIFMLNYCIETVVSDPRPGMMVIFTFEFAILCIFSAFTLMRYALNVWDIAIVKKQTQQAIEDRKSEIRAEREAARQSAIAEDGTPDPAPPSDEGAIEVDANEVDVPGWEERRRYLFALEVFTDFLKLMIYIVFFTVSVTFNGLPMHIMRDVYMTFASFSKRIADYVAYRKATSDMNSRYPDATTEEIQDDACIVCRESMVAWEQPNAGGDAQPAAEQPAPHQPSAPRRRDEGLRAKKLPCGHILHLRCLKAWLERQQVCPTCRRPVVTGPSTNNGTEANGNDPAQGQPGQPQVPRLRARMFNIGPLRVGLLNAPNNQMQNIINQIQNPGVPNQNAGNLQRPNNPEPQGPNANQGGGAQQGTISSRSITGTRHPVPVNIQLMQIEQRIMEEAHNLRVEQQQLQYLRTMEAELSRLRALQVPAQQSLSTNDTLRTQGLPQQMPHLPFQPFRPAQPRSEALIGNPAQQIGSGNSDLPAGLVLPEGWTLMPLQRSQRGQSTVAPQEYQNSQVQQAESSSQPTTEPARTSATTNGVNAATESSRTGTHSEQTPALNGGPTDDQGSPLFLPSQSASSSTVPSSAQAQPVETRTERPVSLENANVERTAAESDRPAPWSNGSWSFGDQASEAASKPSIEGATSQSPANGSPARPMDEQGRVVDKGKGRAVEIEDAPDPDAGS